MMEKCSEAPIYSMKTQISDKSVGLITHEQPSLESLAPEVLAAKFVAQEGITLGEALFIIDRATELLKQYPNVLALEAPITIVGDLHGQFFDLKRMLEACKLPTKSRGKGSSSYLFLGDYVDRGAFSCEVLLYLLALKLHFPDTVHLLRGNHECRSLTTHFGFKEECKAKYGLPVYYRFVKLFEMMPLCALVTNKHGRYFCTHGGISPDIKELSQIEQINRVAEPEMAGPLCDLLWADPVDDPTVSNVRDLTAEGLEGLLDTAFQANNLRGCSVSFGYKAVVEFLDRNDLLTVIRAHAVQESGYFRHFDAILRKQGRSTRKMPSVLTVFSAPNYCDRYGNKGAVLKVMEDMLEPAVMHYDCVEHPEPRERPNKADVHLTALLEACPYMPTTFRDFVRLACLLGPAQPLIDLSPTPELSRRAGSGILTPREMTGEENSLPSIKNSILANMPASTRAAAHTVTPHYQYERERIHDRINEQHPGKLLQQINKCKDEDVNWLSQSGRGKIKKQPQLCATKITIQQIREQQMEEEEPSATVTLAERKKKLLANAKQERWRVDDLFEKSKAGSRGGRKNSLVNQRAQMFENKVKGNSDAAAEQPSPSNSKSNSPKPKKSLASRWLDRGSKEDPKPSAAQPQPTRGRAPGISDSGGGPSRSNSPSRRPSLSVKTDHEDDECSHEGTAQPSPDYPKAPSLQSISASKRSAVRQSFDGDQCAFSHAEILGLKLLFALMDQMSTGYVDQRALAMYAKEQDDFAQEKEIAACIEAVDIDGDDMISMMDFVSFAARLKSYYDVGIWVSGDAD
ncbi:unnamed protein product [Chrysoparadoxa australica]